MKRDEALQALVNLIDDPRVKVVAPAALIAEGINAVRLLAEESPTVKNIEPKEQ